MKVAILGFGVEGKSSADYWAELGNKVTICDKNPSLNIPSRFESKLGDSYLENLSEFDLIIRSPGVHPAQIQNVPNMVTSNTNEFVSVCPTTNVISITGTKGKGTTSSLIAHILETAGKRVHIGGNIGLPPLELLTKKIEQDDWIVLELSNFQLIDLKRSPRIAVCLLVEPEHQDWHGSVDEYVQAKQQLFRWQSEEDIAIYYSNNELSKKVVSVSAAKKIPYFSEPGAYIEGGKVIIDDTIICEVGDIRLLGKHNWQNVCAAVTAVWQVTKDNKVIKEAISSFVGLPFRLELRGKYNGVSYYNDSFSSQPEAAIAAIEAVTMPKVVILGGYDRNLDLTKLAKTAIANDAGIKKLVLIGASSKRLADALKNEGYENYIVDSSKSLADIVATAKQYAVAGDAIVLSPGFPSFDMFKNFEDRGIQFNKEVPKQ